MPAPFRIQRWDARAKTAGLGQMGTFGAYLDRLLKMIPAEVVSLYLVGVGLVPEDLFAQDRGIALGVWALVCLTGVVILRGYGTADPSSKLPPDWVHVAISSVAFVIWVYSMGGPFEAFGLHVPFIGSLVVLAWTFFAPVFYKGPQD